MATDERFSASRMADSAEAAGEQVREGAAKAKDAISNMARSAADRLSDTRATTADGLESAASALHTGADHLPGDAASGLAHSAADRLRTTADYVRRTDASRMMADVETLVKNNPGLSLGIAAAFGFLLGRAMIRD